VPLARSGRFAQNWKALAKISPQRRRVLAVRDDEEAIAVANDTSHAAVAGRQQGTVQYPY